METLKLDGRDFVGISQALTANQDDYILAHLRLSGAIEVLSDLIGPSKQSKEEKAENLLTQILLSGRTHHILAGCLTEVGKKWNRADAERNAAVFAEITAEAEKTAMREAIVRFVVGFFRLGEPSSTSSPNSSNKHGKDRPIARAGRKTSGTSIS